MVTVGQTIIFKSHQNLKVKGASELPGQFIKMITGTHPNFKHASESLGGVGEMDYGWCLLKQDSSTHL